MRLAAARQFEATGEQPAVAFVLNSARDGTAHAHDGVFELRASIDRDRQQPPAHHVGVHRREFHQLPGLDRHQVRALRSGLPDMASLQVPRKHDVLSAAGLRHP